MAAIICATDCSTSLPPVNFSSCAPQINLSEIGRVFIAKSNAAPFENWLSPVEWAARLEQSGGSDDAIRTLTVIGDKPAPTGTPVSISGGRTVISNKTHVVNFTIDETTPENHEFMRALECGGQFKIWYETLGGLLFGGNDGILATIAIDMVLERGTESLMVLNGTATWKNRFTEERGISPIAGSGGDVPATFNTTLDFSADVDDTEAGVTGTVAATNAVKKFEFNAITPQVGTPQSMEINVSSVSAIVVDYTSDYNGHPFRYVHSTGVVYTGTFVNGSRDF